MHWKIIWREDGVGEATHEPSGVIFNVSKSGWIGVVDPSAASESELRRLMSELVIQLGLSEAPAASPDPRLLH